MPVATKILEVRMGSALTQRVQVPNNEVLGIGVIVMIVQVLGKYMIIRYLDPKPLTTLYPYIPLYIPFKGT